MNSFADAVGHEAHAGTDARTHRATENRPHGGPGTDRAAEAAHFLPDFGALGATHRAANPCADAAADQVPCHGTPSCGACSGRYRARSTHRHQLGAQGRGDASGDDLGGHEGPCDHTATGCVFDDRGEFTGVRVDPLGHLLHAQLLQQSAREGDAIEVDHVITVAREDTAHLLQFTEQLGASQPHCSHERRLKLSCITPTSGRAWADASDANAIAILPLLSVALDSGMISKVA
mmetsp:Transcript_8872/g.21947  ORF Transcript_8872/g.21947 Transcript_8872/m.21947 type:complete len:233 (+) Transcript_8872:136-834(+)